MSVAVAVRVTDEPPTVAPFVGTVNSTVGGVWPPKPVTVTVVSQVAVAPDCPVTVSVYSLVVRGVTLVELERPTESTLVSEAETAFVDDHVRSELSPSVTVGSAAVMLQEGAVVALLPPPPKPGETSVTVLSEADIEDCADVAEGCVLPVWLCDCCDDAGVFVAPLDALAVCDTYERVSGPK